MQNEYKQRVIAEFNSRDNYDNDFRFRLANRLVELAQLKIENLWNQLFNNALIKPQLQLSSEQLEQFKGEYIAAVEALVTDNGIWNDVTTFLVLARK